MSGRDDTLPAVTEGNLRAVHLGNATNKNTRPWIAYVSDRRVMSVLGVPRRFGTSEAALAAARYEVARATTPQRVPAAWPEDALPKGTRVRFTLGSLGASERDDIAHVVGTARYGIEDVGIVDFPHPNQKGCRGWVFVAVDSKEGPPRTLYVGVAPGMIKPVGETTPGVDTNGGAP